MTTQIQCTLCTQPFWCTTPKEADDHWRKTHATIPKQSWTVVAVQAQLPPIRPCPPHIVRHSPAPDSLFEERLQRWTKRDVVDLSQGPTESGPTPSFAITAVWENTNIDFDLHVITPQGKVFFGNPKVEAMVLDVNPRETPGQTGIASVSCLPGQQPSPGTYAIYICQISGAVGVSEPYTVRILHKGKVLYFTGEGDGKKKLEAVHKGYKVTNHGYKVM